jgi:hypothetical protein
LNQENCERAKEECRKQSNCFNQRRSKTSRNEKIKFCKYDKYGRIFPSNLIFQIKKERKEKNWSALVFLDLIG